MCECGTCVICLSYVLVCLMVLLQLQLNEGKEELEDVIRQRNEKQKENDALKVLTYVHIRICTYVCMLLVSCLKFTPERSW